MIVTVESLSKVLQILMRLLVRATVALSTREGAPFTSTTKMLELAMCLILLFRIIWLLALILVDPSTHRLKVVPFSLILVL